MVGTRDGPRRSRHSCDLPSFIGIQGMYLGETFGAKIGHPNIMWSDPAELSESYGDDS